MGQFWNLINIEQREEYGGVKLGEWLFAHHHVDLMDELRLPAFDRWLTGSESPTQLQHSGLLKLPNEMLDMVFAEIRDPTGSMLRFALTCRRLLAIGKRHIVKFIGCAVPTWAHCRLICLGANLDSVDDLPQGMLTDSELAIIAAAKPEIYERNGRLPDDPAIWSREPVQDFLNLLGPQLTQSEIERRYYSGKEFHQKWALEETSFTWGPLDWRAENEDDWTRYKALLNSYPEGREVLCNLSKGVYVSRDSLDVSKDITLAHILISQICWSDDESCSLPTYGFEERIRRGVWAGDRFCITTLDNLPKLESGEWKDVSESEELELEEMLNTLAEFDLPR
ncbi:hypothetical protein ACG7TL_004213 [Trametes sanguinea]